MLDMLDANVVHSQFFDSQCLSCLICHMIFLDFINLVTFVFFLSFLFQKAFLVMSKYYLDYFSLIQFILADCYRNGSILLLNQWVNSSIVNQAQVITIS